MTTLLCCSCSFKLQRGGKALLFHKFYAGSSYLHHHAGQYTAKKEKQNRQGFLQE
jgi:hypothetical protein